MPREEWEGREKDESIVEILPSVKVMKETVGARDVTDVCGMQVEKEPEKMDAEAVRRTLEAVVDTRPSRCRDHAYEFTRLDSADTTTSIIISYHSTEFYNVKLALTAIVEHTPYDLYTEIVVLDDGTTDNRIRRAATAFLRDPRFNKVPCSYWWI